MSHPSWVRGLKHLVSFRLRRTTKSHPSWVRGLKHRGLATELNEHFVAPLVGAWIETQLSTKLPYVNYVAPLVGAWIETYFNLFG